MLRGNSIGDVGLVAISKILVRTKLKVLYLDGNTDSDTGSLTNVDTGSVTDVGVLALAKELPFSELRELYLDNNDITDAGLRALAEALPLSKVHCLSINFQRQKSVEHALRNVNNVDNVKIYINDYSKCQGLYEKKGVCQFSGTNE
jgi:hypothetical protein